MRTFGSVEVKGIRCLTNTLSYLLAMSNLLLCRNRVLNAAFRNLRATTRQCSSKPVETKPQEPSSSDFSNLIRRTHKPNAFEQKILVWTGKYKSAEEVPQAVSHETMEKARNKARIKVANYMMAATAVACIIMALSGKRAAERGESVSKMNLDWHKEMNKQSK